jgi:rhodanese-related sulfurtransferase
MLMNPSDYVALAKAKVKECAVTDAQDCASTGTMLVDIRELNEYQRGHIPGAVYAPRGLLEFEIHRLVAERHPDQQSAPEERAIVLYCGTGGRSALAAKTLMDLGYRNVRSMAGGIVAWNAAGLPVEVPRQA